jgi:hypothetical protein
VQKEVAYQFGNSPMKFLEQTRASPTNLGLLSDRTLEARQLLQSFWANSALPANPTLQLRRLLLISEIK